MHCDMMQNIHSTNNICDDYMNNVNKTLYIPLYGKAYVSKKGLFLNDKKAEEIWGAKSFAIKGKSKSKWLAYYMGIRASVFDEWTKEQFARLTDTTVIHIGCGMDSRAIRIGTDNQKWYDVDFADVIKERKKYYTESDNYKMIAADVRDCAWLTSIKETRYAIVVMEGVSMYLTTEELKKITDALCNHFENVSLLTDCYTSLAAKMSKHANPINEVGVTEVHGIDDPQTLCTDKLAYATEHVMIPQKYIDELHGAEKYIFAKLYAGRLSQKLYRLFEYKKK